MSELRGVTKEQRKRVDERIRSIATRIETRNTYHSIRDCEACRYEPCAMQFELWDLERELERWKHQPFLEIEKEDKAREIEDQYFSRLTGSRAAVIARFLRTVESKITIDDYGDEVISHLGNEIEICIGKLKMREGVASFPSSGEAHLRTHLSKLFAECHGHNKASFKQS